MTAPARSTLPSPGALRRALRQPRERLRRRLGIQLRSALAAAMVVAFASVLTGVAFVAAAHLILLDNVRQSAGQRAAQVAAAVGNTSTASLTAALRPSPRDRTIVQVLDPTGRVIAASAAVSGAEPISGLRPAPGRTRREQRRLDAGHGEPFEIVALTVQAPGGPYTVLVGQSVDEVDDATSALTAALAVGLPVLTLVVGAATFLFVGRTLRPVEAMRRQATTISATNLHLRLPVPPASDEVSALATTMNTMLDRIEAAATAQRRFVADASHELRSPMATIHVGLELLATAGLPAAASAHITRLRGESVRMARLIDDLLLLARVDESGLQLRHDDVDLDDVVYAERDRITAERPDLYIVTQVTPARVTGDVHHLQRAVRNVVDNAARHARTRISITLGTTGDHADLTIIDDGPGIPNADRKRVFDRFVRLDHDRSRLGGGAGLGLPITRDILTAHGGTITVLDAPGGGARITLRLPI
jgi:signal transduction histidine kinase